MQHLTLTIDGMHCGSCSVSIELLLNNTTGISSAQVNFESKKAEVDFDPSKINTETIIKSIEEVGFKAEVV